MKYFKVVDRISSAVTISTDHTNYSMTLPKRNEFMPFLEFIASSSEKFDLPIEMYFILNNNLAISGSAYLKNFPDDRNGIYFLSDFISSNSSIYSKYHIEVPQLVEIIQEICSIGVGWFDEGFYLWEYLCDKERKDILLPCRYDSFFLFDNISDCEFYIQNHKGGGVICEVELIDIKELFKADMSLLDSIESYATYKEAKEIIGNYWKGAESGDPVFEYLFQGRCRLIPVA